jgi:hypothetical protein
LEASNAGLSNSFEVFLKFKCRTLIYSAPSDALLPLIYTFHTHSHSALAGLTQLQLRRHYEALRKARLSEFMAGFNVISLKLKEMYQVSALNPHTIPFSLNFSCWYQH